MSVDTQLNNASNTWSIPGIVMKSAFVKDKLSICGMNSQSICAKKMCKIDELRNIAMFSGVDIMCVCESWLKNEISDDTLKIDGYNIVRNDRKNRIGGGILIYLKSFLNYKVIKSSQENANPSTEFIFLEVAIGRDKVLLGCFYNTPNTDCPQLLYELLSSMKLQYEKLFLIGDFNTNILNKDLIRTKNFLKCCKSLSLVSAGEYPTHFHRTGASQIDLILTNKRKLILRFNQVAVPFMSNHDLIFASIDVNITQIVEKVCFRDYTHINSSLLPSGSRASVLCAPDLGNFEKQLFFMKQSSRSLDICSR